MHEILVVTSEEASAWLDDYKRAWEERDVELALSLFTQDVDYREVRFGPPLLNHAGLEDYWRVQVGEFQRDIHFSHQLWGVRENEAIATWQAEFTWLPINGFMKIDGICKVIFAARGAEGLKCSQFNEWFDFVELDSVRHDAQLEPATPKVASSQGHWDLDSTLRQEAFFSRPASD